MARIARVVAPGLPHLVTQRGNRDQQTFFTEDDYQAYLALVAEWSSYHGVQVWSYCLMPNHVHLIMVPLTDDGLRRPLGEAHRRYTRRVNLREGWRGHLWQGRFASYPLDDHHLLSAAKYVELSPVAAGMVKKPERYPWSSAGAHLRGRDDLLVKVAPLLKLVPNWRKYLSEGLTEDETRLLRRHERTGRPLGSVKFLKGLEKRLGRVLRPQKRGRKSEKSKN